MLKCVECGFSSRHFRLAVAGIRFGSFVYAAECPRCGSRKISHLPGHHEQDLRLSIRWEHGLGAADAGDAETQRALLFS